MFKAWCVNDVVMLIALVSVCDVYYVVSVEVCPVFQIRDLRMEAEELQHSRVLNDVVAKAELKVKELEDTLQTEARWVE